MTKRHKLHTEEDRLLARAAEDGWYSHETPEGRRWSMQMRRATITDEQMIAHYRELETQD